MADLLETESKKYEQELPNLLAHEGKFILITGSEIVGIYDTYADALNVGYEKCGLKPFLVKKIQAVEEIQFFSRDLRFEPCLI